MKTLIIFIVTLLSFVLRPLDTPNHVDGYYEDDHFIIVRVDPETSNIITCYKNADGEVINNFSRLKKHITSTGHELIFACNGGMFMEDLRPLGLYVEKGRQIMPLNTRSASTNFYIKPNGVFYILSNGSVGICRTEAYELISGLYAIGEDVKYATQSGPMLTIDGLINGKFNINSTSYKHRNGVGINQDGDVIFIISKAPVSFYEFADAFLMVGCANSLFLDGDISDFYYPPEGLGWWYGYMSVFIAVVK